MRVPFATIEMSLKGKLGWLGAALTLIAPASSWAQQATTSGVQSAATGTPAGSADPAPSPVVTVPGATAPLRAPYDAPAGAPSYKPDLPLGTPSEQASRDPALPVTTLTEALDRAYWTNPALLAERARARSIDYRLPQARAQFGPRLQYSGSYDYQRDNFELSTGDYLARQGWTSTATAILTQPLFTFGRSRAREDEARGQIAFQRTALRASEQQTLLGSINIYVSVLRDRAAVTIAGDNVELLSRELSDTRLRLEQHESTATDYEQVQSRLELARAELLAAQGRAASSDATFLRIVGAPAGDLAAPNPLRIPALTIEDAYVYADSHNPIIASAYARERISRAAWDFAKADRLPQVDFRGQASLGTVAPYSDNQRETNLRAGITVSGALDGGILQARVREAAAANDADWRLIDDALRENRAELADGWISWQTQTAAIERLRNGVEAAQSAIEGGLLQERAGLRTTIEILELARDLLQVRSGLNAAMADAYVQQARVLAAMGTLDREYLSPDGSRYDAEAHSRNVAHIADVPLLTPLVRALDSVTAPPHEDRPVRDPAGPIAVDPGGLPATAP